MKNSVAETGKVSNAITDAFEYLGFVVTAFGKAIGVGDIKRMKNIFAPVMNCSGTLMKCWKAGIFSVKDPFT